MQTCLWAYPCILETYQVLSQNFLITMNTFIKITQWTHSACLSIEYCQSNIINQILLIEYCQSNVINRILPVECYQSNIVNRILSIEYYQSNIVNRISSIEYFQLNIINRMLSIEYCQIKLDATCILSSLKITVKK